MGGILQALERKFVARRGLWAAAVEAVASLDALMALAGEGGRGDGLCPGDRASAAAIVARFSSGLGVVLGDFALSVAIGPWLRDPLPPTCPDLRRLTPSVFPPLPPSSQRPPGAALSSEGATCRPRVLDALPASGAAPAPASDAQPLGPFFRASQLRHPAGLCGGSGGGFVPNDVSLGAGAPRLLLLTGPNMGGKSTLLRQVCLAAVLAQVRRAALSWATDALSRAGGRCCPGALRRWRAGLQRALSSGASPARGPGGSVPMPPCQPQTPQPPKPCPKPHAANPARSARGCPPSRWR
jgi:hypothetical protein